MKVQKKKYYIQYLMSLVGGFYGAYAILNFQNAFASSQTMNLIQVLTNLLGGNINEFLIRFFACILYIIGIISAVIVSNKMKIDVQKCCIIINIIAVFAMLFMPNKINNIIAIYPLFFITAFQWCAFHGVDGYSSSCTISTNNIRNFVISGTNYILNKDRKDFLKMKYFGLILAYYHVGVVISFVFYKLWGRKEILISLVPMIFVLSSLDWNPIRIKNRTNRSIETT